MKSRGWSRFRTHGLLCASLCCTAVTVSEPGAAKTGTHAPATSGWDTRASNVAVAARPSLTQPAHFFSAGYNANFAATSGNLSAQFGLHYLQFREDREESIAHGVAASATALFSLPVTSRYDNGVPKAAIGFYFGLVPTGLISGQLNFLTLPLAVGLGVPVSPASVITLTPWIEAAPGVNVDSDFSDINLEDIGRATLPDLGTIDPNDPNAQQAAIENLQLSRDEVAQVLAEGINTTVGIGVGMRVGLETALHLSESFGITAYAVYGTFRGGFAGTGAFQLGGALVFRWDDIVPAVLPASRRLEGESCEDVETRFRSCPHYERLLQQHFTPAPAAPAAPPPPPKPVEPEAASEPPAETTIPDDGEVPPTEGLPDLQPPSESPPAVEPSPPLGEPTAPAP